MVVGVQLFSLGLFGELVAYHFRTRRPFEPAVATLEIRAEPDAQDESSPRAPAREDSGGGA